MNNDKERYSLGVWALYQHLTVQSNEVLRLDDKSGKPTFIYHMAEAISNAVVGDSDTLPLDTNDEHKVMIRTYIKLHLNKVVAEALIPPSLLLLASLESLLLEEEFKPLEKLFGDTLETAIDFIKDFTNRTREDAEVSETYATARSLVDTLLSPGRISYKDRNIMKKVKADISNLLAHLYNDSMLEELDAIFKRALSYKVKYQIDVDVEKVMILIAIMLPYRYNRYESAYEDIKMSIHPSIRPNLELISTASHALSIETPYHDYGPEIELVKSSMLPIPLANIFIGSIAMAMYIRKPGKIRPIVSDTTKYIVDLLHTKHLETFFPPTYVKEYDIALPRFSEVLGMMNSKSMKVDVKMKNGTIDVQLLRRKVTGKKRR